MHRPIQKIWCMGALMCRITKNSSKKAPVNIQQLHTTPLEQWTNPPEATINNLVYSRWGNMLHYMKPVMVAPNTDKRLVHTNKGILENDIFNMHYGLLSTDAVHSWSLSIWKTCRQEKQFLLCMIRISTYISFEWHPAICCLLFTRQCSAMRKPKYCCFQNHYENSLQAYEFTHNYLFQTLLLH